jgi:hypothetical protein
MYTLTGINAFNSNLKASGCSGEILPCPASEVNTYANLLYGVYAYNSTANIPVKIHNSEFINTLYGIYLSGVEGAEVHSNEFNVLPYIGQEKPYGLYMENCFAYHVEDNSFQNLSSLETGNIGIHIINSGATYNEIYNNKFKDLTTGIMVVGENRNGNQDGLCIKCNDFEENDFDVYVTKETLTPSYPSTNVGIAYSQGDQLAYLGGDLSALAGNLFSIGANYNIRNSTGTQFFHYYYHGINNGFNLVPIPVNNYQNHPVTGAVYIKDDACPSTLDDGGVIPPDERSKMAVAQQNMEITQATLSTLVDGGDTEALNTTVETGFPDEGYVINSELEQDSPYLSERVMKTSIEREDMLPNMMIRDMMVNNPHAPKSEQLLLKLQERNVPMPDYMLQEIMEGLLVTGSKETIELELSKYSKKRQRSFNRLYKHYLTNENAINPMNELIVLLDDENNTEVKYKLAMLYVQQNQPTLADATLEQINSGMVETVGEIELHDDYITLIDVLKSYQTPGLGLEQLSDGDVSILQSLATKDNKPAHFARNILAANNIIEFDPLVYMPEDENKSISVFDQYENNSDNEPLESRVEVYPNPASDYFIIDYQSCGSGSHINILTTTGILIKTVSITRNRDQMMIPTKDLDSGIYLIQMVCDKEIIHQTKLSIIK